MKKTIKTTLIAILLMTGMGVRAQTANFNGTWKRNDDQTDPGGLSINSVPRTLEISSDNKAIYIKGTAYNKDGVMRLSNDTLRLDGSMNQNGRKQNWLTSSPDKQQFTNSILITDKDGKTVQEWKQAYSLTDSGKTLKIVVDLTFNGEAYQMAEAFDKQ
jgi:hypothetical protein